MQDERLCRLRGEVPWTCLCTSHLSTCVAAISQLSDSLFFVEPQAGPAWQRLFLADALTAPAEVVSKWSSTSTRELGVKALLPGSATILGDRFPRSLHLGHHAGQGVPSRVRPSLCAH